jgi:hypothetical protein
MTEASERIAALLEAAARYERDANAEFPGSYYRKRFRALARSKRRQAAKLAGQVQRGEA